MSFGRSLNLSPVALADVRIGQYKLKLKELRAKDEEEQSRPPERVAYV